MISRSSNSHRLGTCSPAPTLCCLDKHAETFIIIVIESIMLDFFGFKIIYLTMFKSQWRHCNALEVTYCADSVYRGRGGGSLVFMFIL